MRSAKKLNHNDFLKISEQQLVDLPIITKTQIIQEIDLLLKGDALILEQKKPSEIVDQKRKEHGFAQFKPKKKFRLTRFLLKAFTVSYLLFAIGAAVLVWKFTPLIKMDEENQRVIILGGLIDIDGKAGKVKFLDEYHFGVTQYKNQFQGDITLDSETDEVSIIFNSGAFDVKTSEDSDFKFDCKVEKVPTQNIVIQEKDIVKLDFTAMSGAHCSFSIPVDKKISFEGSDAKIDLVSPEYDLYINIKNGNVSLAPAPEVLYNFDLKVTSGYTGVFESSDEENAFEIKIFIENGSISNH